MPEPIMTFSEACILLTNAFTPRQLHLWRKLDHNSRLDVVEALQFDRLSTADVIKMLKATGG